MIVSEEPWLRGPVAGIIAELQPAAHELIFAREELERIFAAIADDMVWQRPHGIASIGYHIRHCAGSTHRMLIYARGRMLSPGQLQQLADEKDADPRLGAADLLRIATDAIDAALAFIRNTKAAQLDEERLVGRKQIRTNLRGLLYEIAIHTARHVGQLATTAKVLR